MPAIEQEAWVKVYLALLYQDWREDPEKTNPYFVCS